MDTGDIVLHRPTGERWIVAFVSGEYLSWCGWPEGVARVEDCELVKTATPEQRRSLLHQLAEMKGSDSRKTYAKHRLDTSEIVLPSIY